MKILEYLRDSACIMNLKAIDKKNAIEEIAGSLNYSGKVINLDLFINDVLERESLGSTGIGNGVALPHSRTSAVKGFVIAFGRSENGVEFNALDGKKVNLIFLMGTDPQELNLYLRILAELSKLLMDASFRQMLMSAKISKDVIDIIQKFEKN